ncbi:MAG: hypothetical protein E7351_00415 [Clostridiales bacterium]|nr:hypothetical protein [Clostridiales bacterium]
MKKFSAILVCLLMIVTAGLAGCATFSINKEKYYNEILATVGDTAITRFDVLTAYNSYGQTYYVTQQGMSEDEAIKETLELLIDRESLYQYALSEGDTYKPSAYQVNTAIGEMFDSLDKQMDTYIETAKNILDIEIVEDSDENTDNETAYKYEDYVYKRRATVKERTVYYTDATKEHKSTTETAYTGVEYYIEYIVEEEPSIGTPYIDKNLLEDFNDTTVVSKLKEAYLTRFEERLNADEKEKANILYDKAISLFAQDLIDYEYYLRDSKGKAYNKLTSDLLNRYFERTFDSQIQSLYIENVRTVYLENPNNLNINDLLDEYQRLSTISYNKYKNDTSTYKSDIKDFGTDGDTILYHPNTDAQFGYFTHTLISFNDTQKTALKAIDKADRTNDNVDFTNIINQTTAKARNATTGLVEENAEDISLSNIVNEYNQITKLTDYKERLSAFTQFMFKYTGDATSTLVSGMPYVVGTDGNSAMVEEFNTEAEKLMKQERGAMSEVSLDNLSDMCITEYGIHFLFYIDDVSAYDIPYNSSKNYYIQPKDIEGSEYVNLFTKVINPLTGETYFDMLFDIVYPANSDEVYTSNNNYTSFEKGIVDTWESKVTRNTDKIKATKANI